MNFTCVWDILKRLNIGFETEHLSKLKWKKYTILHYRQKDLQRKNRSIPLLKVFKSTELHSSVFFFVVAIVFIAGEAAQIYIHSKIARSKIQDENFEH